MTHTRFVLEAPRDALGCAGRLIAVAACPERRCMCTGKERAPLSWRQGPWHQVVSLVLRPVGDGHILMISNNSRVAQVQVHLLDLKTSLRQFRLWFYSAWDCTTAISEPLIVPCMHPATLYLIKMHDGRSIPGKQMSLLCTLLSGQQSCASARPMCVDSSHMPARLETLCLALCKPHCTLTLQQAVVHS